jgi:ankyrin repeat protein
MRALTDAGAKLNKLNQYGETPIEIAAANGHESAVKILLKKGAKERNRALSKAKDTEVISLLEEHINQYPQGINPPRVKEEVAVYAPVNPFALLLREERFTKFPKVITPVETMNQEASISTRPPSSLEQKNPPILPSFKQPRPVDKDNVIGVRQPLGLLQKTEKIVR